jgi:RNA polymerase sigma factor (sigma-70 family)
MQDNSHYPSGDELPSDSSDLRAQLAQEENLPNAPGSDLEQDEVPAAADTPYGQWVDLVERIRQGDHRAMEELYVTFSRGIRYYLCRQLGLQELDDRVHDAYLIVVQAIRSGVLREPERLMGFVRTVVRRQVAAHIEQAVAIRKGHAEIELGARVPDQRCSPEEEAMHREKTRLMVEFLREISARDREILTRFYLYGQSQEQICLEMGLTSTQFRLLKSRAKGRFGQAGRRRLAGSPLQQLLVRKKAAGGD